MNEARSLPIVPRSFEPIPYVGLLLSLGSIACGTGTPSPPEHRASPSETTAQESVAESEGEGEGEGGSDTQTEDECDPFRQRFREAMARASGQCQSDAECGCFSPVVSEAGCGGITDRATSDALAQITQEYRAQRCPWPRQCARSRCEPVCRQGRCVNGAGGGRVLH